jgi:3-methyladenine DNA glycosylase AlkD
MNIYHQELLEQMKIHQGKGTKHSASDSYLSSGHAFYSISVPVKRDIARSWVKRHTDISENELLQLVNSLFTGKSYEEKTIASLLLEYLPRQRKKLLIDNIDLWTNELQGWAEIDSLCQSVFTAKEVLDNWSAWEKLITKLSQDNNINKRRASIVLLTKPASVLEDKKIAVLSFAIIDMLQAERDILITKAISWLLRSLVKYHKTEVAQYIEKNKSTLPAIAVRETKRKIQTGKK